MASRSSPLSFFRIANPSESVILPFSAFEAAIAVAGQAPAPLKNGPLGVGTFHLAFLIQGVGVSILPSGVKSPDVIDSVIPSPQIAPLRSWEILFDRRFLVAVCRHINQTVLYLGGVPFPAHPARLPIGARFCFFFSPDNCAVGRTLSVPSPLIWRYEIVWFVIFSSSLWAGVPPFVMTGLLGVIQSQTDWRES